MTTGRITTLGTVHITKKGIAHGSIECGTLTVEGRIDGEAVVRGRATVHTKAALVGELKAHSLLVEDGAEFDAMIDIGKPSYQEEPIDPETDSADPSPPEPIVKRTGALSSMLDKNRPTKTHTASRGDRRLRLVWCWCRCRRRRMMAMRRAARRGHWKGADGIRGHTAGGRSPARAPRGCALAAVSIRGFPGADQHRRSARMP